MEVKWECRKKKNLGSRVIESIQFANLCSNNVCDMRILMHSSQWCADW